MASELNKKEKEEPVSSSIGSLLKSTMNFLTEDTEIAEEVIPLNVEEEKLNSGTSQIVERPSEAAVSSTHVENSDSGTPAPIDSAMEESSSNSPSVEMESETKIDEYSVTSSIGTLFQSTLDFCQEKIVPEKIGQMKVEEIQSSVSSFIGSQIQTTMNFFTSSDKVCPINDEEQKQPSAPEVKTSEGCPVETITSVIVEERQQSETPFIDPRFILNWAPPASVYSDSGLKGVAQNIDAVKEISKRFSEPRKKAAGPSSILGSVLGVVSGATLSTIETVVSAVTDLEVVPVKTTIGLAGSIVGDVKEGGTIGKRTVKTLAKTSTGYGMGYAGAIGGTMVASTVVGGCTGTIGSVVAGTAIATSIGTATGAMAGTAIGGSVGVLLGGVGAIPLGVAGAYVGGMVGGLVVGMAGSAVVGTVANKINNEMSKWKTAFIFKIEGTSHLCILLNINRNIEGSDEERETKLTTDWVDLLTNIVAYFLTLGNISSVSLLTKRPLEQMKISPNINPTYRTHDVNSKCIHELEVTFLNNSYIRTICKSNRFCESQLVLFKRNDTENQNVDDIHDFNELLKDHDQETNELPANKNQTIDNVQETYELPAIKNQAIVMDLTGKAIYWLNPNKGARETAILLGKQFPCLEIIGN